jgi:hypothetical protein
MTIKEIGHKMAHQDNRATQYPMFAVYEIVEHSVGDGCGESRRKDFDCFDLEDLCDKCAKLHEDGEDLPDYCDECHPDCFWNCEEKLEPNLLPGVFFTAEACQKHIDENYYHYNKPVVYGIGSWRNPEMVFVIKHILTEAGEEIPSFYK